MLVKSAIFAFVIGSMAQAATPPFGAINGITGLEVFPFTMRRGSSSNGPRPTRRFTSSSSSSSSSSDPRRRSSSSSYSSSNSTSSDPSRRSSTSSSSSSDSRRRSSSSSSHHWTSRHPSTRTSHCTSHHTSHHTSHCWTSRRCTSDKYCTSRRWTSNKCCTPKPICCTTTVTTTIGPNVCVLQLCPHPTNTATIITSTIAVLPTSAAVLPTNAAVQQCTPCTNYVTTTVHPTMVCTTMHFCDLADISGDCKSANREKIQSIIQFALRDGGEAFINGERVVFSSSSSGGSHGTISSSVGSTVLTVTGQQANDANMEGPFASIATIFGVLAAVALFM